MPDIDLDDLDSVFAEIAGERPDRRRVARIAEDIAQRVTPVRPIVSANAHIAFVLIAVCSIVMAVATWLGLSAVQAQPPSAAFLLFAALGASIGILATVVVNLMIPGSQLRVQPAVAIALPLASFIILVPLLFRSLDTSRFWRRGFGCLGLGCATALAAGLVFWLILRWGWADQPRLALSAAGALCGVAGLGALTLHCTILTIPHILVWHLGVVVVPIATGYLIGASVERFPR